MAEIAVLRWEEVSRNDEEHVYKFTLHRSKARRSEQVDQDFFLPYNVYDVNVYSMVEEYRQITGGTGPMWRRNGSDEKLGHGNVAAVTKRVASFLKLSGNYTRHGLRATGATWMADHGATELELKIAGNWSSSTVANSYIRKSTAAEMRRATLIMGTAPSSPVSEQETGTLKETSELPNSSTPSADDPTAMHHFPNIFINCTITNVSITIAK